VGAKHSALFVNQCEERQDAVYNHRPLGLSGPPIQIYNPAFVTFIREMSHPYDAMEFSDEELEMALKFIITSLDLHQYKSGRRGKANELRALGYLLGEKILVDSGVITLDGMTNVMCPTIQQEATVRVAEVQNEIGEGDSDPITRAECDFVLICSSEKVHLLLFCFSLPRLTFNQFHSTNRSERLHVVRCYSSGSPARISPSLVPSSRTDSFRNDSQIISTLDRSQPSTDDPL